MSLTLITGPANAGKAGRVLDAYRASLHRAPLLVVPTPSAAAHHDALAAASVVDADLFAWRALDALRARPQDWAGRPAFLYGFDDFTGVELAVLATLAGDANAEVTVALTFEAGRTAFAGRRRTHERLLALADEHVECPAREEHYAPDSRAALHHLERNLFELGAARQPPPAAVR